MRQVKIHNLGLDRRGIIPAIFAFIYNVYYGVNCKNDKNISRKLWTNRVDYGKICIGEQPGFCTWRLDRFGPVKGGCNMTVTFGDIIGLCQLFVAILVLLQGYKK